MLTIIKWIAAGFVKDGRKLNFVGFLENQDRFLMILYSSIWISKTISKLFIPFKKKRPKVMNKEDDYYCSYRMCPPG